jgi:hypothetical protein
MGKISYKAEVTLIAGEPDLFRRTPIQSFSVTGGTAKTVDLNSTNDTNILFALGQAKSQKNLTLFKTPSKDDLDAILSGLSQKKTQIGFNFDIYASYTGTWIQIVHFFGEDATVTNQPSRIGAGKTLSLKVEFSLPKVDFKHGDKQNGKWIDDEEWIR